MKHSWAALIILAASCSDASFSPQVGAPAAPDAQVGTAPVAGDAQSDRAPGDAGEPTQMVPEVAGTKVTPEPLSTVIEPLVALPQMITGSYLVSCVSEEEASHKLTCRVEQQGDARKVDLGEISWEVRDSAGDLLAASAAVVRALPSDSLWHIEIEMLIPQTLRVTASWLELTGGNNNIGVVPFTFSPPSSAMTMPRDPFLENFSVAPSATAGRRWMTVSGSPAIDYSSQTFKCSISAGASPMNQFSGIASKGIFDFTAASFRIQVLNASTISKGSAGIWGIAAADNVGRAYFEIESGFVKVTMEQGSKMTSSPLVPFDPVAHRYLRIHHTSSGTLNFLTSADGVSWIRFINLAPPAWPLTATKLLIQCGGRLPGAAGSVEFDDLQLHYP